MILFPCHPLYPKKVDPEFEKLAAHAGEYALFDFEALTRKDVLNIAKRIPADEIMLYIGWMMTPEQYTMLTNVVWSAGSGVAITPKEYTRAHYFNGWYNHFRTVTPVSKEIWSKDDIDYLESATGSYFIKDFVKSRKDLKHCSFAETKNDVLTVINNLLSVQGSAIQGGIVAREFEEFEGPEYRLWYTTNDYGTKRHMISSHPDEAKNDSTMSSIDFDFLQQLEDVVKYFHNPFISVDVKKRKDGKWRVIEIGYAGVSSVHHDIDHKKFMETLNSELCEDFFPPM